MKKIITLSLTAFLILGFTGCNKNENAKTNLIKFYNEMSDLMDNSASELEKAQSGETASNVINYFSETQRQMLAKGKELEQYKNIKEVIDDPEVKSSYSRLQKSAARFNNTMSDALAKFLTTPAFMESLSNLRKTQNQK